jgi:predicted RNA binding protein YcfA (HicA-like mRNA interferase family)
MTTKLPALTGKALIAALAKGGFEVIRIKGSHHYVRHPDGRPTVIPVHAGETDRLRAHDQDSQRL